MGSGGPKRRRPPSRAALGLFLLAGLAVCTGESFAQPGEQTPGVVEEDCAVRQETHSEPTWLDSDWDGLPELRNASETLSLELGGRLQLDYRSQRSEGAAESEFLVRRARVKVEGALGSLFDYKLQMQFGIGSEDSEIKDGYVELRAHERLRVQLGRLKAPFSQEELQSSKYMEFVERSLLNTLAPGRALGVLAYGSDAGGRLQYELAAMNRATDISSDVLSDRPEIRRQTELFGRLRTSPFERELLENLSFGGALGHGLAGGESVFEVETASEGFQVLEPLRLSGSSRRRNAEAWWWYRNMAVQSEYLRWSADRDGLAPDRADLPPLSARGFMIQGLVVLTGESKSDKEIRPRRPLLRGGFGAVELGVRYDWLEWDGDGIDNRVDSWTLGVNWWPFDRVHYRVDLNWDWFRSPPASAPGVRRGFAVLSRVQIFF